MAVVIAFHCNKRDRRVWWCENAHASIPAGLSDMATFRTFRSMDTFSKSRKFPGSMLSSSLASRRISIIKNLQLETKHDTSPWCTHFFLRKAKCARPNENPQIIAKIRTRKYIASMEWLSGSLSQHTVSTQDKYVHKRLWRCRLTIFG